MRCERKHFVAAFACIEARYRGLENACVLHAAGCSPQAGSSDPRLRKNVTIRRKNGSENNTIAPLFVQ
jgi:hypothetical protein